MRKLVPCTYRVIDDEARHKYGRERMGYLYGHKDYYLNTFKMVDGKEVLNTEDGAYEKVRFGLIFDPHHPNPRLQNMTRRTSDFNFSIGVEITEEELEEEYNIKLDDLISEWETT